MSGRVAHRDAPRAQLPLLDRLIDDAPESAADPPLSAAEALAALRRSVQRDLEALLNARRRWRSWPAELTELNVSAVGYGIPDFTAGALNDPQRRERLRAEIEETIRRFEPRFASVRVLALSDRDEHGSPSRGRDGSPTEPTLRLRIEAMLRAEPAPEPVAFDTLVNAATADVVLRESAERERTHV